jgi:ribosomal protein S8
VLNKEEILHYLINHTKYVAVPFQLAVRRDVAEYLIKEGYFDDDIAYNFSEKALETLNTFYEENKERVIQSLKRIESPFSYDHISKELSLSSEDGRAEYLLKRLAEDGTISISASSNWEHRIKVVIN